MTANVVLNLILFLQQEPVVGDVDPSTLPSGGGLFQMIFEGGPIFTIPILAIGIWALVSGVRELVPALIGSGDEADWAKPVSNQPVILGSFAFILGLLGQVLGLYEALRAIQIWGSVSPQLLAAGLRVSMITVVLGLSIFALSGAIWIAARVVRKRYQDDGFVTEAE